MAEDSLEFQPAPGNGRAEASKALDCLLAVTINKVDHDLPVHRGDLVIIAREVGL